MTSKCPAPSKKDRLYPSDEYKEEALRLAAQSGIASASKQLGLHESQLYQWRKQAEHHKTVSERETALALENARLGHVSKRLNRV